MSGRGTSRALIAVVAAILAAEVFTQLLLEVRPREELWEWFIQLTATALAALFAVGVFEYQSRQAEGDRQNRLLAALAAELQSNLDIIRSEHRTAFLARVQGHRTAFLPMVFLAREILGAGFGPPPQRSSKLRR